MGKLRLLVENAVREVVLILHRDGIPSITIQRAQQRLTSLQRDVVECEQYRVSRSDDPFEINDLCHGIVSNTVDTVLNIRIPEIQIQLLEARIQSLTEKVATLTHERNEALEKVERTTQMEARHNDAHNYALHCYFREVLQLRQTIAGSPLLGQSPAHHNANQSPSIAISGTSSFSSGQHQSPHHNPFSLEKSFSPDRKISMLSTTGAPLQSASMDASHVEGGGKSGISLGAASNFAAMVASKRRNSNALAPSSKHAVPDADKTPSDRAAALGSVDAIFDYEKYLDLERSDYAMWEAKFKALRDDFSLYSKEVERDKVAREKAHKDQLQKHIDKYALLEKRVKGLIQQQRTMQLVVAASVRQHRHDVTSLKHEIMKLKHAFFDQVRDLERFITSIGDYHTVLMEYVATACKYMVEQFSHEKKLEEVARFNFQRALVPNPATDTPNMREAKLYWRKNEVAGIVLSTVMEMRHFHTDRSDALRRADELKEDLRRTKAENRELVDERLSYAFVGLNTLLDAAAAHYVPPVGSDGTVRRSHGDMQVRIEPSGGSTPSAGKADDSFAGSFHTNSFAKSPNQPPTSVATRINSFTPKSPLVADDEGPRLQLLLPPSASWVLGNGPLGLLPGSRYTPEEGRMIDAAGALGVDPMYLRAKLTVEEIEDILVDRLFLHRMFVCGQDPNCYMRDDDRNAVLRAWRNHMFLVHERNHLIIDRIGGRKVHRIVTHFYETLLLSTMKSGFSSQAGAAAATASGLRVELIECREAVQRLREFDVAKENAFRERRNELTKAIYDNGRVMYEQLDRHFVQQMRGIFPTLRAHDVTSVAEAASVDPRNRIRSGGKNRRSLADRRGSMKKDIAMKRGSVTGEVDWKPPSVLRTVETQTVESGPRRRQSSVAPIPREAKVLVRGPIVEAKPTRDEDPPPSTTGPIPKHRHQFLVQTVKQFATVSANDDESADFFRVESLQPPRCISIPTTGGIGAEELNMMSVKLLTKSSLMTTSVKLREELEEEMRRLDEARDRSPPRLMMRPSSGMPAVRPPPSPRLNSASISRTTAVVASSLQKPPVSGSTTTPKVSGTSIKTSTATPQMPPASQRLGSASSARVGRLPPPVYEANNEQ